MRPIRRRRIAVIPRLLFGLTAAALAASFGTHPSANGVPTRLLRMPTVSATQIAFAWRRQRHHLRARTRRRERRTEWPRRRGGRDTPGDTTPPDAAGEESMQNPNAPGASAPVERAVEEAMRLLKARPVDRLTPEPPPTHAGVAPAHRTEGERYSFRY